MSIELSICYDRHPKCKVWATEGLCEAEQPISHIGYMTTYCRESCDHCTTNFAEYCYNHDERCAAWAAAGKCRAEKDMMSQTCQRACHLCTPGVDTKNQRVIHEGLLTAPQCKALVNLMNRNGIAGTYVHTIISTLS